MNREQAIKTMQNLNKVINGSNAIIEAVQSNKNINLEKAIKACCKSNVIIAQELKNIVQDITVKEKTPYSGNTEDMFGGVFGDIFKG